METLNLLLKSSKFWTALFLLVQAVLFYFLPQFPKEIWTGIDVLFGVIVSVLVVDDVKKDRALKLAAKRDELPF